MTIKEIDYMILGENYGKISYDPDVWSLKIDNIGTKVHHTLTMNSIKLPGFDDYKVVFAPQTDTDNQKLIFSKVHIQLNYKVLANVSKHSINLNVNQFTNKTYDNYESVVRLADTIINNKSFPSFDGELVISGGARKKGRTSRKQQSVKSSRKLF